MKQGALAGVSCLLCISVLYGCGIANMSGAACVQGDPDPSSAAPGETFVVRGGGFWDGCNDTGPPFLREPARQDIRVDMRQGDRSWPLASGLDATPPPDYFLEVELEVPEDAREGKATVVIPDPNSAEPMTIPFRVE